MFDPWVKAIIIGFALLLGGVTGWGIEHSRFTAYQARIDALGEAQEARTKETIDRQKQIAYGVKTDYEARIAAIRSAYRVRPSGSGLMPPASQPSGGFDGKPTYAILAEQCTETTQQLISLQDFIKETR